MAVICRDLRLLFLCVPKTGCSAVAKLLIERYGGAWLPAQDIFRRNGSLLCGRKHSSVDDLLKARQITAEELRELTIMATTRHPFDWLLSHYYFSRWVYETEGEASPLHWVRQRLRVHRHAATHSFAEHVVRHWLGFGRSVCWRWAKRADVILRYETLQQDLDRVLGKLGVAVPELIPLFNVTPGRPPGLREHYSPGLAKLVRLAYAADFRRFGYDGNNHHRGAPPPH